jgi:hypothetical protein
VLELEKKAHVQGLKVLTKELMEKWNQLNIVMGALYVTSKCVLLFRTWAGVH